MIYQLLEWEFVTFPWKFIQNVVFLFLKWYYTFFWLIWFKSYKIFQVFQISRLRDSRSIRSDQIAANSWQRLFTSFILLRLSTEIEVRTYYCEILQPFKWNFIQIVFFKTSLTKKYINLPKFVCFKVKFLQSEVIS